MREAGIEEPLSEEEQFVAACSRGDEVEARAILARVPGIFARLHEKQLHAMPDLASIGNQRAVHTLLALGWPLEIKSVWGATALNLAVFQGDSEMASLLLDYGADWRTLHSYRDNVVGTLSYASQAEDIEAPSPRDYVGCERGLLTHGMPIPEEDGHSFSPEVAEYFDSLRLRAT